ncbi:MAG: hypothetical protein V3T83_15450 [Acidobacteriota bacterium]
MRTPPILILLLSLISIAALSAQGRSALVAVVVDSKLSHSDIRKLERELERAAQREGFRADYAVTSRYRPSNDYDYVVHVDRRRGFNFDECGFRRNHYEWRAYNYADRQLGSAHRHRLRNTARDIARAIRHDWRRGY